MASAQMQLNSERRPLVGGVAYIISMIGSPPVVTMAALLQIALSSADERRWTWAVMYFLIAVIGPSIYMVWQLSKGQISDLDVTTREQRFPAQRFTTMIAWFAWLVMRNNGVGQPMLVFPGMMAIQMLVILLVTTRWKISVHCASMAGATTFLWHLNGSPWSLAIGLPVLAWSRLIMRRHSLAEIVAGSLLGPLAFLLALTLAR